MAINKRRRTYFGQTPDLSLRELDISGYTNARVLDQKFKYGELVTSDYCEAVANLVELGLAARAEGARRDERRKPSPWFRERK